MSHLPNWQEYGDKVGQDKPMKDATEVHDKTYGDYKPIDHNQKSTPLPNEPKPFSIKGS